MRVSVLAVGALSLAATLAAGAIGLSWHHERDQADAVRELTQEVAALRAQLAGAASTACTASATADPPPAVVTAVASPSVAPARAPIGAVTPVPAFPAASTAPIPPAPPIEPRVGDGGRPMNPAQAAALASATDLVDAALRRGTISRSEMAILRARIAAAGHSDETDALRAEIADAIDQGAVVAERPAPVWH